MDKTSEFEKQKAMIKDSITGKLRRHFGTIMENATQNQIYRACAMTVRDHIMERWADSRNAIKKNNAKQLYYLSVEFLMGRFLNNNLVNLLRKDVYREALGELGISLDNIIELEPDAALGNGGLGRLAAAFLDSLATLGLPGHGYGIRYEYGLFKQKIIDGYQIEMPDPWLEGGSVWEVARPEEQEEVRFGGRIKEVFQNGKRVIQHEGYHSVIAIPYDIPIVGYDSPLVNTLRLWSARSPKHLDMRWFSSGNYVKAFEEKQLAEVISKVLYPEDNHYEGKSLRLKQYYFFISATMQSIIRKHKRRYALEELPDKVAIHINDTHPSLAIPELMRILLDNEGMEWDRAWDIVTRTFAYTNHTVMAEALERWPVTLFRDLFPRIYMIVHEINEKYCRSLWSMFNGQWKRISDMAIIAYDEIRMANLSIVGSHAVNGVSNLHTEILKKRVFNNFYKAHPDKFLSITNGMNHRRWLIQANPQLAQLITETIGDGWIKNPEQLKELEAYASDAGFREDFRRIKALNKRRLADYIMKTKGIIVDPDSIFDVQIKRLHEYKRQLLNILHIMYLYNRLRENPNEDIYPRTFIFGAKASPGYHRAKLIIKLINSVAEKINNDMGIGNKLKVVFLDDYRVTLAEKIIPAAEVSEQISTSGKEASGTGNMKLMLNGALTIGTLDGANVEIMEAVGAGNIYIFGLKAIEVERYYQYGGYNAHEIYEQNRAIMQVMDQLVNGFLEPDNPKLFSDIHQSLLFSGNGMADPYMVLKDFDSYEQAQELVDWDYRDPDLWWRKAVINTANAGKFSSDRTVKEYNEKIWRLKDIRNM